MTDNPTNRQMKENLRVLRSVRKIQPTSDAMGQALKLALATAQQVDPKRHKPINWKGLVMRTGIAAALLIAVGLVSWLSFSNGEVLAAPTWADVSQSTKAIQIAHIDGYSYQDGKLTRREEYWIKSPGIIRVHEFEIKDGQAIETKGSIATPQAAVRWNEKTRLAEITSTDNVFMVQSAAAHRIEAVLGLSLLVDHANTNMTINGEQVTLVAVQQTHPKDASLRGFKLQAKDSASPLPEMFQRLVYWFDAKSNTLRRITASHGEHRSGDAVVNLNPQVEPGWFETSIPQGYVDIKAGVRSRLSPEVREVYDQVAAARQRFGDYRAVIWREHAGGWPTHRESLHGNRWRCDTIDWTLMHSAMYSGDNPRGYIRIKPADDFAKVWQQVMRADYEPEITVMTWQDRYAIIHYNLSGRGPRISAKLHDTFIPGYGQPFASTVRLIAWPEWSEQESLHLDGWNLSEPIFQWSLLPSDPNQPNLVHVIGQRESKGGWYEIRHTFDRSKDWLCVHREHKYGYMQGSEIWSIESFKQTSDGMWYPGRVYHSNGKTRYELAVQRGAAEEGFFTWPKGVPQPSEFFPKPSRAATSVPSVDLPKTAKGKYTTYEQRGLPRGFDDKATFEAHYQMMSNMRNIRDGLNHYANKQTKWTYPDTLQKLVRDGYLKPEILKNPLHPESNPPFEYIRPDAKLPNYRERMVLYESFKDWPGVVTVIFNDGSVEHIHDKAEFEKLLREATSPEPPSRPDDDKK